MEFVTQSQAAVSLTLTANINPNSFLATLSTSGWQRLQLCANEYKSVTKEFLPLLRLV
jgi:hypothetical protein